ncbi:uncharacterized protein LOC116175118 isoform X2 [Photinus pyralis]|uniref:uncharacterized protein LOC116175118 isoform X2 n=1 Tax=Photinus pyralis TaxID=7054 RepID=UPI001267382E|nr:uncharacterized protein LOC116175118 isoform X2 [Photinus pyralis]
MGKKRNSQGTQDENLFFVLDAGETAKDGLVEGAHQVKTAVASAVETVGNNISSSIGKVSDTFKTVHEDTEDVLGGVVEDAGSKANETLEVVSEAETVLASEVDNMVEEVSEVAHSTEERAFDKVEKLKSSILEEARELHKPVDEKLEVQDMEDAAGSPVNTVEITNDTVTATIFTPPEEEVKKDEP